MVCPSLRGDTIRTLASGLSHVQVEDYVIACVPPIICKGGITQYHLISAIIKPKPKQQPPAKLESSTDGRSKSMV